MHAPYNAMLQDKLMAEETSRQESVDKAVGALSAAKVMARLKDGGGQTVTCDFGTNLFNECASTKTLTLCMPFQLCQQTC